MEPDNLTAVNCEIASLPDGRPDRVARLRSRESPRGLGERSPVLRSLVDSGQVGLVGGMHDLESGRVRFFGE